MNIAQSPRHSRALCFPFGIKILNLGFQGTTRESFCSCSREGLHFPEWQICLLQMAPCVLVRDQVYSAKPSSP